MTLKYQQNPEPVPPASQLAALPFLAAVEGFLRGAHPTFSLRLTIHRVMNREGRLYLQQVCDYVGSDRAEDRHKAGRMFPLYTGIIGAAFNKGTVFRTRHYSSENELRRDIKADMERQHDARDPATQAASWLAVPFRGPSDEIVLILFAETQEFNYFADDSRTRAIVDMCWGFARRIDSLVESPFPTLRNFAFESGEGEKGRPTVFETVQEQVHGVSVPKFNKLRSFNFEAAAV